MTIFRKLLISVLSMALLLAVLSGSCCAYIQGDINGDGDVTLRDAILIMKSLARMKVTGTIQKASGGGRDQCLGLDDVIHVLMVVSNLQSKNSSPRASFSLSVDTGNAPLSVEFDASGSSDSETTIARYEWAFGDGTGGSGSSPQIVHTYMTPGTYQSTLTVIDAGGARDVLTKWVAVTGQTKAPPDPATVAPALDNTVSTTIKTATAFLYTGVNPIQEGVIPDKIEQKRAAVLRGKVTGRDGAALPGVRITVLDHLEFGQTLTRDDGMFDLAVNGGGVLTISYSKADYLAAQRQAIVPWQDFVQLSDVVMLPVDPHVTTFKLSDPEDVKVARGSVVTDHSGERQATLLFAQGTTAQLVMPDGSTQPVDTLSVRATEYSVGRDGPNAMPAELPPNIGYTYCVEFSVDEAMASGAKDIQFNQPVINYLENYLQAAVGSIVPSGFYDRTRGTWVPSDNGRVIKVLTITGSPAMAEIDTDGDGLGDDVLGISEAERRQLATLYTAGQSLWRVPVTHFTPWDYNWPFGPPNDATYPKQPDPKKKGVEADPCEEEGSIIDCHNQILGQVADIVGTPFQLHYRSYRAPGYKPAYVLEIPLSGPTVPSSLIRIEVEIQVAGRSFDYQVVGGQCPPPCLGEIIKDGENWVCRPPVAGASAASLGWSRAPADFTDLANRSYTFTWDGKDAYGRVLQGSQPVTVRIGYTYCGAYQSTDKFGYNGNGMITGSMTNREVTLWQAHRTNIGPWDARPYGLGGWTLSEHHAYDPVGRVLYLGNGKRRSAQAMGLVLSTVAGTGVQGYNGDGIPATNAQLSGPRGVASGPDGSLYFASDYRIRRVDPDGIISTVAGTGIAGYNGDGIPATTAQIGNTMGVALGPDGSLYFDSDYRIRRVDPDGIISTVAGTGIAGYNGDEIPATQAQIKGSSDLAVGPDGNLYIADASNNRIRRVGTDGIITTMAEVGSPLRSIAVGPGGSLYFSSNDRAFRLGPDGLLAHIACTGDYGYSGDGGLATQALCANIFDVVPAPDGSVYLADWSCIRRVGPDGIITTVAGRGWYAGFSGDNGPATQGTFRRIFGGTAVGQDGLSLYVGDLENKRVRRVSLPLPGLSVNDLTLFSEDGSEGYVFNALGRHLRTLDALTGALRYEFAYDGEGRLATVTDGDGNVTTVERDMGGNPTAIMAPFGQRTVLAPDADGYLESMTNPSGESTRFRYTDGGLLEALIDPRGFVQTFTYDNQGFLSQDNDPAGGSQAFGRTDTANGYEVMRTTGENRTAIYRVENLSTGDKRRVNVYPDNTQTVALRKANGSMAITLPDGNVITKASGPDPRFGMQTALPQSVTFATPGGRVANMTMTRSVNLSVPGSPLSLSTLTDSVTINGRNYTSAFDAASFTFTDTTPGGRKSTTKIDALGRVIEYHVTGLSSTRYAYDGEGLLIGMTQGSGTDERTLSFHYNPAGRIQTITDPLFQTFGLTYDPAGRLIKKTLPDGRQIAAAYDANGNVRSIIPPGRPAHSFEYDSVDLLSRYVPPDVLAGTDETQFSFNKDGQLTRILRPDGQPVDVHHDGAGRLSRIACSDGMITYDYFPATGQLKTINAPGGTTLNYTYDGSLLTGKAWTGPVTGRVTVDYDNNFRVTGLKINEGDTIPFQYDPDSLTTQAGALTLTFSDQNGLLTETALGNVTDIWTYNGFGEPTGYTAKYNTAEIFKQQFNHDKSGRIIEKSETVGGVTDTYKYVYDPAGRLTQIEKNGSPSSSYSYDGNNNRLTGPSATTSYIYDAQDRLGAQTSAQGTRSYAYSANGELQSTTQGNETTAYKYDAPGTLMSVMLPDGRTIEYLADGLGRRIGKKINGAMAQGFLYLDGLKPLAELDGYNTVVSVFVYGSRYNVPDYMMKEGNTYRIISDPLGSPRLVVNSATGEMVQQLDYDEFGHVTRDTNPGFQPFGFAGGLYDPQTGLVRFGARDYAPAVGRWTAKDPLLFDAWSSSNTYEYVLSDPVNRIDPEGKKPIPIIPAGSQSPRLSPGAEKLLNWQNEMAKPMMQKQFSTSPGGKGVEILFKALTDATLICMGWLPTAPGRSLLQQGAPGWREARRIMEQQIKDDIARAAKNLPAPASLPRGAPTMLPNLPAPASLVKPNLQVPVRFGP